MDELWDKILDIGQRILNGGNITRKEAEDLYHGEYKWKGDFNA